MGRKLPPKVINPNSKTNSVDRQERGKREKEKKRKHKGEKKKKKKRGTGRSSLKFSVFRRSESVARELKLVYSTRATNRFQEQWDFVLHPPRGSGFLLLRYLYI